MGFKNSIDRWECCINPLNANPTKCSNTLKSFVKEGLDEKLNIFSVLRCQGVSRMGSENS